MYLKLFACVVGGLFVLATAVALGEHSQAGWAARPATAAGRPVSAAIRHNPINLADTFTPTFTSTPPTATPTPTPDCSSVNVHPTFISPPGAFIYVTVPQGWTWSWDPITPLMRYNCSAYYPTGVSCSWGCSTIEPRIGRAVIHIYDQIGVERCSFWITGSQPSCPPTATPTAAPPTRTPTPFNTPTTQATSTALTPTPFNTPTTQATSTAGTSTPESTPSPSLTVLATGTTATAIPSVPTATLSATPEPTTQPTATMCAISFTDIPPESTYYQYIRCLACRGIVSGYLDGSFRPNNSITRGQIAKVVSNAAGFIDDVAGRWTYHDVPDTQTFWQWVERLTLHQVMSGYQCGGANEPCDGQNRPYFRPGNNATRGQLSKIVSNAANYNEEPQGQMFTDVPPNHTFYVWIQQLATRGIIGGYQCGGANEPCDGQNRPYFRPYNNVTRGQASKIVANTFYPSCQTPER